MALFTSGLYKKLMSNPGLGAGNFLFHASKSCGDGNKPFIFTDKFIKLPDGHETDEFSLSTLQHHCELLASWYLKNGIQHKDLVAVYLANGIEYFLHYLALTAIGATPVLLNGKMAGLTALQFCVNAKIKLVVVDEMHYNDLMQPSTTSAFGSLKMLLIDSIKITEKILPDWFPYQHKPDDVIMICHTSGTTGFPKPVTLLHNRFFKGIADFLENPPEFVTKPSYDNSYKMLSALPAAHNSAMAYFMRAVLTGMQIMIVSELKCDNIIKLIRQYRPSTVVSFPWLYVELVNSQVEGDNLESVSYWISTGDAAHHAHIKKLIKYGHYHNNNKFEKGSCFLDCLGSSEMGSSLFRLPHRTFDLYPLRCVGTPMPWVCASIFNENETEILGNYVIGKLGVKSQSVTSGYWNNKTLDLDFRRKEYFLTGDMVYRDQNDRFYQIDRITDTIKTKHGILPSILAEEIILNYIDEIYDCIVIGLGEQHFQQQSPMAIIVQSEYSHIFDLESLKYKINIYLSNYRLPNIERVELITNKNIPIGITGKVLKRALRDSFCSLLT